MPHCFLPSQPTSFPLVLCASWGNRPASPGKEGLSNQMIFFICLLNLGFSFGLHFVSKFGGLVPHGVTPPLRSCEQQPDSGSPFLVWPHQTWMIIKTFILKWTNTLESQSRDKKKKSLMPESNSEIFNLPNFLLYHIKRKKKYSNMCFATNKLHRIWELMKQKCISAIPICLMK